MKLNKDISIVVESLFNETLNETSMKIGMISTNVNKLYNRQTIRIESDNDMVWDITNDGVYSINVMFDYEENTFTVDLSPIGDIDEIQYFCDGFDDILGDYELESKKGYKYEINADTLKGLFEVLLTQVDDWKLIGEVIDKLF